MEECIECIAPSLPHCKCASCKQLFVPTACRKAVQEFCSKPECRKASKDASQRRWRRKNPDYFKGPEHVERVRQWRTEHPRYWRGKQRSKNRRQALQDLAPTQTAESLTLAASTNGSASDFSQKQSEAISCSADALQDLALAQTPLILGLASVVMGDALQEDFIGFARQLVERGRRVMGAKPTKDKPPWDAAA